MQNTATYISTLDSSRLRSPDDDALIVLIVMTNTTFSYIRIPSFVRGSLHSSIYYTHSFSIDACMRSQTPFTIPVSFHYLTIFGYHQRSISSTLVGCFSLSFQGLYDGLWLDVRLISGVLAREDGVTLSLD